MGSWQERTHSAQEQTAELRVRTASSRDLTEESAQAASLRPTPCSLKQTAAAPEQQLASAWRFPTYLQSRICGAAARWRSIVTSLSHEQAASVPAAVAALVVTDPRREQPPHVLAHARNCQCDTASLWLNQ